MQKEGLVCGEDSFCPATCSRVERLVECLGLLAELEHVLHLPDMFGRKGGAAASWLLPPQGSGAATMRCLWHLLTEPC